MKVQVFASTSPGGDKHLVSEVELDFLNNKTTARGFPFDGAQQYWDIRVSGMSGATGVILSPERSAEDADRLGNLVAMPSVQAEFLPQAWINDYAVDCDGRVIFNALPALIDMELDAVRKMFDEGSDFDCLADSLQERQDHDGPFEVSIEESDLIELVCLLSSNDEGLGENARMGDVPEAWWDDACTVARSILRMSEMERQSAIPPKNWEDWFERFKPKGADPEKEEAYLLRDLGDPEVLRVIQEDPSRVWTSLDVDGVESIASGVHFVNRMGYYLCEVPYSGPPCDVEDQDPHAEPQSWGELVDRFEPQPLPVARDPGNLLRSASDAELRQLSETDPARIWTVLDVGGAETIVSGFQETVGAAYIVCKVPYLGCDCEIVSEPNNAEVQRQRG